MSDNTPDPAKPDLSAFAAAVRLRDRATAAAVAYHERVGLPGSSHYARATFDAIAQMIREDEREKLAAAGRLVPPVLIEVERWKVDLPQGPVKGIAESDARRLAAEHGGTASRSLVRLLTDGTEVLGSWLPVPTATAAAEQPAWERRATATGGGPCPTCEKPFYIHVCLSCSPDKLSPGPGCVNCRNTGMDQTPCRPAPDKES